jgi:putative ABC transport system permease protein
MLRPAFRTLRSLARRPAFTATVIGTLALGIGANVALYSIVAGVLWAPLPFAEPDNLAIIWEHNVVRERRYNVVSPANYIGWREQSELFTALAALSPGAVTLTGESTPMRLDSAKVTDGFFELLGVEPFLGRAFEDADGERVVVLDYEAWRGRFGGDPTVIGDTVSLNDVEHTIVGVMPSTFRFELEGSALTFGVDPEFWLPLPVTDAWREQRGRYLIVLGRIASELTLAQARAEMVAIASRLERDYPASNTGWSVNVVPLVEQMVGAVRPTLLALFGGVALVLVLACVNVANLMLGRGISRRRDVAIRTALGAGSARIAGQLLLESALMTLLASILGVAFAFVGVSSLKSYSPISIPRLDNVSVDAGAIVFAVSLGALTTILFGIVPALQARATDVQSVLRGDSGGVSSLRFRSGLVASEVAMTVVLLTAAGLLGRTLLSYGAVDPGFGRRGVLTMRLALPEARYTSDAARLAFFDELRSRLATLPGVDAVSVVSSVPLTGPHAATSVYAGDRPPPADGEAPVADIRIIGGDYFRSMGVPLLAGRTFDAQDDGDQPRRAILSAAAIETLWPGLLPSATLGKTVQISWDGVLAFEVVGVVGDVRHAALDSPPRPMIYWPHHQHAWGAMALVIRGGELSVVKSEVLALDPSLPAYDVRPAEEIVSASVMRERFSALLLGAFALAALGIASLGVYGVIGFFVSERRREMGLRLALGASPRDILTVVMGRGMTMTLIGVGLGLLAAGFTSRFLASLLFGVKPFDPLTLASVCLVLMTVAIVASYLPARRASRVDPAMVLRSD